MSSVTSAYPPLALTSRQRTLGLAAVVASTAGVGLTYGIGYPLTSLALKANGAEPWLIGIAGSAPAAGIVLAMPVLPALVGRLGAVGGMTLGCLLLGVGFLLMPLFPGAEAWIALRFMMGAGLALPWLVGEAWINTVADDRTRGRFLALYSMTLFAGFAIGPVILETTGPDGWAAYLVGAGGALLAVVPILLAASLAPALPAEKGTNVFGAVRLAPVAMVAGLIGGFLEMAHFALLPLYGSASGTDPAGALRLLTAFMVGGIALQVVFGWLSDRASPRVATVAACIGYALAASALAASGAEGVRLALSFLMGGFAIALYTLGLAIIGRQVAPESLTVANAAYLIAYQAGALVGPAAGGAALGAWTPQGFVVAMAAAALVGAVGTLGFGSRNARTSAGGHRRHASSATDECRRAFASR